MAAPSKQDAGNSLDLVDIKEIKQNTVVVKDGSLRQVIMVGGVNFSLKSDTGAEHHHAGIPDIPEQH